jgi:hypothetical protein
MKEEILNIMRRIDLDGDTKITYYEFCEALVPLNVTIVNHPGRLVPESTSHNYELEASPVRNDTLPQPTNLILH